MVGLVTVYNPQIIFTDLIICPCQMFVVDSTSSDRELLTAQGELGKCLENPTLVGLPLLILCNKQDLIEARPVEQVGG